MEHRGCSNLAGEPKQTSDQTKNGIRAKSESTKTAFPRLVRLKSGKSRSDERKRWSGAWDPRAVKPSIPDSVDREGSVERAAR